ALVSLGRRTQLLASRIVSRPQVVTVCDIALERTDGDWLIDSSAAAGVFTRVRADPAEYVHKRVRRAGQHVGLFVLRQADGLHIPSALRVDRAGGAARDVAIKVFLVRNRHSIWHRHPPPRPRSPLAYCLALSA